MTTKLFHNNLFKSTICTFFVLFKDVNILVHGLGSVADDAIDQFQNSINLLNTFAGDLDHLKNSSNFWKTEK